MIAANRDELISRAWDAPGEYWPALPGVIAGRDRLGGGAWMGVNRHGVFAAVLNRRGTLGPAPGKRSRGELPLLALAHPSAAEAAAALATLNPQDFRPFNAILADAREAYWLRGAAAIEAARLDPGWHMLTADELDDPASPRIAANFADLRALPHPTPEAHHALTAIMARKAAGEAAMTIENRNGFATISSALVFLSPSLPTHFLFAAAPLPAPYETVEGFA
jgi:uncharacterized protein with NRDE domain